MNYELLPPDSLQLIRSKRSDSATTRPLSHSRYDQTHEVFETNSDQQVQILRWLEEYSQRLLADSSRTEPRRMLSVGCGSGILDLPLIESISQNSKSLRYVGIDPNQVACERFREAFGLLELPNVELKLHEAEVHQLNCEFRYDLIHAVHSLYYFADPAADIDELLRRLATDGRLIVFQAPKAELNQLADCFWSEQTQQAIWFSQELENYLNGQALNFEKQHIEACVDVTSCFEEDSRQGEMILDFILQTRCDRLGTEVLQLCRDFLDQISHDVAGKRLAPHPVDVFIIRSD